MTFKARKLFQICSLSNLFPSFQSFHTEHQPHQSLYNQCESLFYFFQLFMTVWKHLAAVAEAVFHISLHTSLFFSRPRLPYLDYAAGWLSQLFCMQVAVAWFFVEGRERARGSEIVPRILRENYSFSWRWGVGKEDEAALFDKLLFERDRYPRGTAVLEMWPTFLNGNGSAHYSFHCSILWLNWNEASKTLCYKVSLI